MTMNKTSNRLQGLCFILLVCISTLRASDHFYRAAAPEVQGKNLNIYETAAKAAALNMDVLNKSTVHIKNREKVQDIISQLTKGGATKLQVIADFDHTLSRFHKNGVPCHSTYEVLECSPLMNEHYKEQIANLANHYHPIEIDPHMTSQEKIPYMIEWYNKSMNVFRNAGISKGNLLEIIEASSVSLRDDCNVVFESLNRHNVPLLVFSAGIGDVLKEVLDRDGLVLPNVKIIANFLNFDEKGELVGCNGTLINIFNKNQGAIENQDYFDQLKSRNNVILLGDSLLDPDMAEGIQDVNAMLKIGFLNYKIEQKLSQYLNSYDIVLTDDQTMDVVVGLLKNIL